MNESKAFSSDSKERRHSQRQLAEGTGLISFGSQEPTTCRVIDLSASGAQVRVDGRRASRNLVGKHAALVLDSGAGKEAPLDARVVWVRPAVNGLYLGLEIDRRDTRTPEA